MCALLHPHPGVYVESLFTLIQTDNTKLRDIYTQHLLHLCYTTLSYFSSSRLDHFDGLIPFDFKTEPTESNSKYLGEHTYSSAAKMTNPDVKVAQIQ